MALDLLLLATGNMQSGQVRGHGIFTLIRFVDPLHRTKA